MSQKFVSAKKNKILNSHFLFLSLILILHFALNLININKFFPLTEGWFQQFAELILGGQVPYRDFYVFVPPGFVFLITALQGIFGAHFIAFRIYGLIERLLLITLTYFILKRFFKPATIFIALNSAAAVYVTNTQDLLYGYYQTCLLMAVLCLFFMLKLYDNYGNTRKRVLYALVLGVIAGVTVLFKQTMGIFVPFALFAVSFLTMLSQGKKRYFVTLALIVGGFILGVLPIVVYLAANDAVAPFVEQIFLGSTSKGNLWNVLLGFIMREFTVRYGYSFIVVGLFSALLIGFGFMQESAKKERLITHTRFAVIIAFSVMLIEPLIPRHGFMLFEKFLPRPDETWAAVFLLLALALVIAASVAVVKRKIYERTYFWQALAGLLTFAVLACFIYTAFSPVLLVRYDNLNRFCFIIFLMLIIICIYHLLAALRTKSDDSAKLLFVLVTALAVMYTHGMSFTLEPHCLLLPFSIVIGLILENDVFNLNNKAFFLRLPAAPPPAPRESKLLFLMNAVKNVAIGFVCFMLIFSTAQKKAFVTYNWWGVNTLPPIHEAHFTAEDENLAGLKLPKSTVDMLDSVKKIVDRNRQEGDTMYTFPHINYFNVMSGMDSTTFGKVHYFDVCSDEIASQDAVRLVENKNTFIVFQDFTDYEWELHEAIFRAGQRSGQRDIKDALVNKLFIDGSYIFVGEFVDGDSNPIQVWIINDGRPVYNAIGERLN